MTDSARTRSGLQLVSVRMKWIRIEYVVSTIVALLLCSLSAHSASLSFQPDVRFSGSSLSSWKPLGPVHWSARDGRLLPTGMSAKSGWIVTERSYQDVGVHASFRCAAVCDAGVLLRVHKTAEGMQAIFVSLSDRDVVSYAVTLDAQGQIVSKVRLEREGGVIRVPPPVRPLPSGQSVAAAAPRQRNMGRIMADGNIPLLRPNTDLKDNASNEVEIFLDVDIIRIFVNNGPEIAGRVPDAFADYGPVGFYSGAAGKTEYRDLSFKDLAVKPNSPGEVSSHFRLQKIEDMYYSWGVAAGDFNHDGIIDIVAGPYIYSGPDFVRKQEIFPAVALNPSKDFPAINCEYVFDYNHDGWPDILTGPPNATLYINPKGESRRWDKYVVVPNIQSEITAFADMDGDGIPELVYSSGGEVRFAKALADPTQPWVQHAVSDRGYGTAHGIGVGDVNGDGLLDIVNPYGWWEHLSVDSHADHWAYHPQAFAHYGRGTFGGATMGVYDVNGDGLNDVVTGLNAHGFGLAWFEQTKSSSGSISFIEHPIADDYATHNAGGVTFSQAHGSTFADLDGDGITDFIVGKRYWTHLDSYHDPDPYGSPVLYAYHPVRNKKVAGGAEFVPELIHNRSGAGSDILAKDLNGDGAIDIVTATNRGVFIFWGVVQPHNRPARRRKD